jgi:hypothetical protein
LQDGFQDDRLFDPDVKAIIALRAKVVVKVSDELLSFSNKNQYHVVACA